MHARACWIIAADLMEIFHFSPDNRYRFIRTRMGSDTSEEMAVNEIENNPPPPMMEP